MWLLLWRGRGWGREKKNCPKQRGAARDMCRHITRVERVTKMQEPSLFASMSTCTTKMRYSNNLLKREAASIR